MARTRKWEKYGGGSTFLPLITYLITKYDQSCVKLCDLSIALQ